MIFMRLGGSWGVTLVYEDTEAAPKENGKTGKLAGTMMSKDLANYVHDAVQMYQERTGKPIPEPPDL
jgi:hypothetical protein